MDYPVRDRPFTSDELERLRLLLSVFRDGSGQQVLKDGSGVRTMPGYRDFERATAVVCGGTTAENKGVLDVLVDTVDGKPFGVSNKMAAAQAVGKASSFMELSNSAKQFYDEFNSRGIDWKVDPKGAGIATIDRVMSWHEALTPTVDVEGSRFLILSHDKTWQKFQLICLPLDLRVADPATDMTWKVEGRSKPTSIAGYVEIDGREHRLWHLYPDSGGQLKYYPPLFYADWATDLFELELAPVKSLVQRAREYYPELWPKEPDQGLNPRL